MRLFAGTPLPSHHGKIPSTLPSKDEVLAFISRQEGKIGTREIARAFNLKNADRAALKRMLRELQDEGRVERRRKKLHRAGTLPSVVLADITERDSDGELLAIPTEWDEEEHGPAPKIRLHVARSGRVGEVPGIGDRALLRIEATDEHDDAVRYRGRAIKIID
ncbi:MAG: ribonuclease R, partial [Bradyrhizobiaceae bacterium]|nr:ribonuclease R [Bradyrhizobiaceae bacterium]